MTYDEIKQAAFKDELQKIAGWGDMAVKGMKVVGKSFGNLRQAGGTLKQAYNTAQLALPGAAAASKDLLHQGVNQLGRSKAALGVLGAGALAASAVGKSIFGGNRN